MAIVSVEEWNHLTTLRPILQMLIGCDKCSQQRRCGACWAITAVETIESAYAMYRGNLYNLAEAEITIFDFVRRWMASKYLRVYHETQGPAVREKLAMYGYTYVAMGVNTCGVLNGMTHVFMKKD
jgi:hypothetical protein